MTQKQIEIIQKIHALREKTIDSNCTEQEALEASKMISKLMMKYDISLSDVEFKKEDFIKNEVPTKSSVRGALYGLISVIARFCDCESYISRKDVINYVFFGSVKDVQIAAYMCQLLNNAIETELNLFKKKEMKEIQAKTGENGRTLTTSFKNGMVRRLGERLNEMIDERNTEKKQIATTQALVLVNKLAIVKDKFEEFKKQSGTKLTKSRSSSTTKSSSGYFAGMRAANKVNLQNSSKTKAIG